MIVPMGLGFLASFSSSAACDPIAFFTVAAKAFSSPRYISLPGCTYTGGLFTR
jgi:hypothetical protein